MTSVFARNYNENKLDRDYFLQATKEGHPLQKQVPQTYQRYTGLGQESIDLDGSNRLVLESDLASGPLIINAEDHYNLYGRVVTVILTRTLQSALTFRYPNGAIHRPGSESTNDTLLIPAGRAPTSFVLDFYSLNDVMIKEENTIPGTVARVPAILQWAVPLDEEILFDQIPTTVPITDLRLPFEESFPGTETFNTSDLTWDPAENEFIVGSPGDYAIFFKCRLTGNLDRCVRLSLDVRVSGGAYIAAEATTSLGLVSQEATLSWFATLQPGDTISVRSEYDPDLPPPDSYDVMNGVNSQNFRSRARNFIQIIQF